MFAASPSLLLSATTTLLAFGSSWLTTSRASADDPTTLPTGARASIQPASAPAAYRPRFPGSANIINEEVTSEWEAMNIVNSDRPDYVDALPTIGLGYFMVESGYTYDWVATKGPNEAAHAFPQTLIRVGLHSRFELRLKASAIAFQGVGPDATRSPWSWGGEGAVGVKVLAVAQKGWIPALTFVGETGYVSRIEPSQAEGFTLNSGFVYGWMINRWLGLRGGTTLLYVPEFGDRVDGGNASTQQNTSFAQAISVSYELSKRVGGYWEWYAFFPTQSAPTQHITDVGVFVYLSKDVSIDLRYGVSIYGPEVNYVGAGVAWRGRFLPAAQTSAPDFIPIMHR